MHLAFALFALIMYAPAQEVSSSLISLLTGLWVLYIFFFFLFQGQARSSISFRYWSSIRSIFSAFSTHKHGPWAWRLKYFYLFMGRHWCQQLRLDSLLQFIRFSPSKSQLLTQKLTLKLQSQCMWKISNANFNWLYKIVPYDKFMSQRLLKKYKMYLTTKSIFACF
jgi:hypothetical protein